MAKKFTPDSVKVDEELAASSQHNIVTIRFAEINGGIWYRAWIGQPIKTKEEVEKLVAGDVQAHVQYTKKGGVWLKHKSAEAIAKLGQQIAGSAIRADPVNQIEIDHRPFLGATQQEQEQYPRDIDYRRGSHVYYDAFLPSLLHALHVNSGGAVVADYGSLLGLVDNNQIKEQLAKFRKATEVAMGQVENAMDIRDNQSKSFTGLALQGAASIANGNESFFVRYFIMADPWYEGGNVPIVVELFDDLDYALAAKEGKETKASLTDKLIEMLNDPEDGDTVKKWIAKGAWDKVAVNLGCTIDEAKAAHELVKKA